MTNLFLLEIGDKKSFSQRYRELGQSLKNVRGNIFFALLMTLSNYFSIIKHHNIPGHNISLNVIHSCPSRDGKI